MGQNSNQDVGDTVINTLLPILTAFHLNLAVQGCQHINRALLLEREVADRHGYEIVSPLFLSFTLAVLAKWLLIKPSKIPLK